MRAKSEIMDTLSAQLNDDIWKKLRNSLLGRELLAFGAEVISENENVKDTMIMQMNPETADKNGLYMLSQMNEIPITNIKPSCVVVEMKQDARTFAPYELQYHVGNVHFTNIEYTMAGKTVSLINGTYKCYAKNMPSSSEAVTYGEETYFYDGINSYYGIRLGNAYPDSVVAYNENGLEIPRYSSDIALANDIDVMYKVVTGVDGCVYVRFICKDEFSALSTFKIDWLDHDMMEFDIDDTTVKINNATVAEVKYYSVGSKDDLDFMRLQLKKEMAKYNGFNTPVSVERYVRGLPYVLDAKCEKSESGINVYIKPSSYLDMQTYLDFSEIAAHISLNSILFPKIKVKTGNQIKFGIEISGVDDVKLQNGIKGLIQDKFSYNNMTFNSVINTGNILSEIYNKYGVVPTINMTIQEPFVQDKPLSFKPIKNTLKLYGVNDAVVAWEENNLLYGMANNSNQIPFFCFRVVASMGTMFLLMQECEKTAADTKTISWFDVITGSEDEGDDSEEEEEENGSENENENENENEGGEEESGKEYSTYDTDMRYSFSTYNKFYLYDVSTNTIKPFDGCMQNLIYSDSSPCLKYNAWNTDAQSFGNLYDVNFLSTNNALVMQIVFKSSGAEVEKVIREADGNSNEEYETDYKLKYWAENNTSLYNDYLTGAYKEYEKTDEYKGKYQTVFFINNPLALKNPNFDSWEIFQDCSHGSPNDLNGLYSGLRNVNEDTDGVLKIKSNWFVHNNKAYYAYRISNRYVYITNGAKNLAISLNGTFLGMMPYENDLYVVNEKYITKVIGFEGLKEKEEIYQIYKDFNTPMTIKEIIREFDNQIVFKTTQDEYYTAEGFEIIGGNKIGFKNMRRIFDDVQIDKDCIIGGCTKDYVTAYKIIDDDLTTEATEYGFVFYCYDLGINQTKTYYKNSTFVDSSGSETVVDDTDTDTENIAVWWGRSESAIQWYYERHTSKDYNKKSSDEAWWHASRLFYVDKNDAYVEINRNDYDKLFFVKLTDVNKAVLCVDCIDEYAYPVFCAGAYQMVDDNKFEDFYDLFKKTGVFSYDKVSCKDLHWSYDSGDTKWDHGINSNYLAGFYKQCFHAAYSIEASGKIAIALGEKSLFYNTYKKVINTPTANGIKKEVITRELRSCNVQITKSDGTITTTSKNYTPLIAPDIWRTDDGGGDNYLTSMATDYTPEKQIFFKRNIYDKTGVISTNIECFKIMITKFYTKTTQTEETGLSYENEDDTKELVTIGYFDEPNNSCVNNKGTEVAYVRYHTQNPNIASNAYLVLDENEIKFI